MNKFIIYLTIFLILFLSSSSNAVTFAIQSLRVGPNPIIRNQNALLVNYVATMPHSANYYLYDTTGRLISQKTYATNTPTITNAGECQFELLSSATMGTFAPQLYIVIIEFITTQETIRKKKYVILK